MSQRSKALQEAEEALYASAESPKKSNLVHKRNGHGAGS